MNINGGMMGGGGNMMGGGGNMMGGGMMGGGMMVDGGSGIQTRQMPMQQQQATPTQQIMIGSGNSPNGASSGASRGNGGDFSGFF